jgi:hypothetical protein
VQVLFQEFFGKYFLFLKREYQKLVAKLDRTAKVFLVYVNGQCVTG